MDKLLKRKDDVERWSDSTKRDEALDEISNAIDAVGIDGCVIEATRLERKYIEAFNRLADDLQKVMIERFIFADRIEEIAAHYFWNERTVRRKINEGIRLIEEGLNNE